MFYCGLILSCWSCHQGHRAQKCPHANRPMYALKRKGRPTRESELLPLSPDTPHVQNITGTEFDEFCARILASPKLKEWYWHEREDTEGPSRRATSHTKPKKGKCQEKAEAKDPKEMYEGMITTEQYVRWKQLCGLQDIPDEVLFTKEWLQSRVLGSTAAPQIPPVSVQTPAPQVSITPVLPTFSQSVTMVSMPSCSETSSYPTIIDPRLLTLNSQRDG